MGGYLTTNISMTCIITQAACVAMSLLVDDLSTLFPADMLLYASNNDHGNMVHVGRITKISPSMMLGMAVLFPLLYDIVATCIVSKRNVVPNSWITHVKTSLLCTKLCKDGKGFQ